MYCGKHSETMHKRLATQAGPCKVCELKDQLATADKHIGWLKEDKIRLNKSIKIRDGAMDAFIDLGEVAAKKLTTAQAENKQLRDRILAVHDEALGEDSFAIATMCLKALKEKVKP